MSHRSVPVAVVGVGNMGENHVRVFDTLPQAELVGIVEPDEKRAVEVGDRYGVPVVDGVDKLDEADAVSIAVPNDLHRTVAESCLEAGLDVLVEKPLATTVEDAEAIIEAAESAGAVLQVGHIERFNPAVNVLQEILRDEEVIALDAHRLGPFNEHLTSESVVFDLMIHDIDVMDSLVDSSASFVDAVGAKSRSSELDHAIAHLMFDSGVIGTATASQVTHNKIRSLTVTARDAYIELDYQDQHIVVHRRGEEQTTTMKGRAGYRTETLSETPFIPTREPLKNELEHFLKCVSDRSEPAVGGADGLRAVRLATDIVNRAIDRYP